MNADGLTPRQRAVAAIRSEQVVAIVRAASSAAAEEAGEALLAAGLGAVEVSMTTPGALEVLKRLLAARGSGAAAVGVGTVLGLRAAHEAIDSGADFLVSPIFEPQVVELCGDRSVGVMPGVGTVTEACSAVAAGADLVKVFPASAWSPGTLRHVLAALPNLALVPTGGVKLADVLAWLDAGAVAVGLGSDLTRGGAGEVAARVDGLRAALAYRRLSA